MSLFKNSKVFSLRAGGDYAVPTMAKLAQGCLSFSACLLSLCATTTAAQFLADDGGDDDDDYIQHSAFDIARGAIIQVFIPGLPPA